MNLCGRPPYQKGHKPAVVPAMRNAARGQACALWSSHNNAAAPPG